MKKNVFVYTLFALLLICVMVSCNNSGTKPQEVIAKNPATLKVNYFRQYYAVGDTEDKLVGSLSYTAEGGSSISQVEIKDSEVKKEGFDTTTTGEGKTLKLTYKGIDVVVTYNVVNMEKVDLFGEFIVGDNTTLEFKKDNKVVKTKWESWDDYFNCRGHEKEKEYTYSSDISSSGRTVVRVDDWNYYPDGKGGILSYPSFDQYFEDGSKYVPGINTFYVSTGPEDNRSVTNPDAKNKYLVMRFDFYGHAYIWFTADTLQTTLDALTNDNAIKIGADQMSFGVGGVSANKVEGTAQGSAPSGATKNLTILMNKDGYDSKDRAFSFVSYSDSDINYKGYSYIMKLHVPTT